MQATVLAYSTPLDPMQHLVAVFGSVHDVHDVPCRIHRESLVSDIFGRPGETDRQNWLENALSAVREKGYGVVMLLRSPFIGELDEADLAAPIEVAPPKDGESHATAIHRMQRWRDVGVGSQILRDLGIRSIILLTPQDRAYVGLGGFGIEITATLHLPG